MRDQLYTDRVVLAEKTFAAKTVAAKVMKGAKQVIRLAEGAKVSTCPLFLCLLVAALTCNFATAPFLLNVAQLFGCDTRFMHSHCWRFLWGDLSDSRAARGSLDGRGFVSGL